MIKTFIILFCFIYLSIAAEFYCRSKKLLQEFDKLYREKYTEGNLSPQFAGAIGDIIYIFLCLAWPFYMKNLYRRWDKKR